MLIQEKEQEEITGGYHTQIADYHMYTLVCVCSAKAAAAAKKKDDAQLQCIHNALCDTQTS